MDNYARITITLSRTEYLSLVDSARQEIRPPRDHARYLLRRILFGEPALADRTDMITNIPNGEVQHA